MVCLLLAGCAATPEDPATTLPAVELAAVPFFPQTRHQCGPAALATVLGAAGVAVTPEALTDAMFVPGRRGSFQVEIKAAARRHGRIAYEISPELAALAREVAVGRPVLILQNLAFDWLPRWHYAVVVGFEPQGRRVLLRSGRTQRARMRLADFERTWSQADRWALVVLEPGQLPAAGSASAYLAAVVAAAPQLTPTAQEAALAAGLERWSDDPDLHFAAANLARQRGAMTEAAQGYRRTLASSPAHLGALNNLADLLAMEGCPNAARALIERALAVADTSSPLHPVLIRTQAEILARVTSQPRDAAGCTSG